MADPQLSLGAFGEARRSRVPAALRGYSADWRYLSAEHLRRFPDCARCSRPASVSHHSWPVKRGGPVLVPFGMLTALCAPCHYAVEAELESGWVAYASAACAVSAADRWQWDSEPAGLYPWTQENPELAALELLGEKESYA